MSNAPPTNQVCVMKSNALRRGFVMVVSITSADPPGGESALITLPQVVFHWYGAKMTTQTQPHAVAVNARSVLLPYLVALAAAMVVTQTAIALNGGEVGVLAGILTAGVAIGIAAWMWRSYRALSKIRFGVAIAHAIAFVVITTSFNAHAVIRAATVDSPATELLATTWFGATLVMSAAWGIGLFVHLTGAVLGRGWED